MASFHNITGSEIVSRSRLMPGYAAVKMAPAKPWRWSWRHTAGLASFTLAALVYAGTNGMLP